MEISGSWRSPAGRLLELEVEPRGNGQWAALHLALPETQGATWIGFTCRSAAGAEIMISPCLRSGTAEGFTDCFFLRHLLALPEALNHVDALHLPSSPAIPALADWRELVLFLPRTAFSWHLHDLRLFTS